MVPTDIKQERTTEPDGKGGYADMMTVHYTAPSGTRSHVKLPVDQYSKENVAAAIHHDMTNIEGVQSLDGTEVGPPAA
jgi:hypothetical protein